MPPIMGAAAFIMADYLQIPFSRVAWAALLPSLLYFTSILFMVHLYAQKNRLKVLDSSETPDIKKILLEKGHLLIPVIVLFYALFSGRSPANSIIISMVVLLVIASLRKTTRPNFFELVDATVNGVLNVIPIAGACAAAGIISGVISLTGLGVTISSILMNLAANLPLLALIFTMLLALVLGLGLPITASYIILAALASPALISMGFLPLAAHMFPFYFALIGGLTPPVAITAFAAAGVAGTDAYRTGLKAAKYALAGYLVPYMFMYNNPLLLEGPWLYSMMEFGTALIGILSLSASVQGFLFKDLGTRERVVIALTGLMMIYPSYLTDLMGAVVLVLFFINARRFNARSMLS